jgi:HAD superfamily hydrolase (TIGR01458 family)
MKTIKGLLFDIGGVLYVGDQVIDGAVMTIQMLKESYPMRFLTNTTRRTPAAMLEKLNKMGFYVSQQELFTALDATKSYIQKQNGTAYTLLTDEADSWFSELKSDKPDFVVVGDAYLNFDYPRLNRAFRALMDGAALIAAAKNRYFKDEDGTKLIGKPSTDFFHLAVDSMGLQPDEVLMIGDDIESDIKGAHDAGLRTALVKTGKFQQSDLQKGIKPDVILPDVTALPSVLM